MNSLTPQNVSIARYLLAGVLFLAPASQAATVWVDDQLYINVRSGKGNEYRILKNAVSGTAFELIGEEDDWSHVRYKDIEGWVRSQYLSKTPIAKAQLAEANRKLEKLQEQNSSLRKELDEQKKQASSSTRDNRQLERELQQLQEQYEKAVSVAKEPLKIDKLNRELNEKNALLGIELEQTRAEVVRLENDQRNEGYRWGAATVLFSMLLGWLVSKRAYKKQSGWS